MGNTCKCGTFAVGVCLECGRSACADHSEVIDGRRLCSLHAPAARAAIELVPVGKRDLLKRFVGDDEQILVWAQANGEWGSLYDVALTDQQLVVVTRYTDEVRRIPRDAISKVTRMPITARGQHIAIAVDGGKSEKWWEVKPKANGEKIASLLRNRVQAAAAPPVSPATPSVAGRSRMPAKEVATGGAIEFIGCLFILAILLLFLCGIGSAFTWLFGG